METRVGKSFLRFQEKLARTFFKIYDSIWETIDARNLRYPFQDGLFQREVYAFNEKSIREAVLNAVAHRNYTINNQSILSKHLQKILL